MRFFATHIETLLTPHKQNAINNGIGIGIGFYSFFQKLLCAWKHCGIISYTHRGTVLWVCLSRIINLKWANYSFIHFPKRPEQCKSTEMGGWYGKCVKHVSVVRCWLWGLLSAMHSIVTLIWNFEYKSYEKANWTKLTVL